MIFINFLWNNECCGIFKSKLDNFVYFFILQCQELLATVHNELTDTVKDLSRTKKKYFELDQAANAAREKYEEANSRWTLY